MATAYTPRVRSYYSTSHHGSPNDISLLSQDIHEKYARALDEIEALQMERKALKIDLNRALDKNVDLSYRDQSICMDLADQNIKFSHTKKELAEAEERTMELEEENARLRHLLEGKAMRLHHLQDEIVSYQDKIGKLDHLEVYNKHLQAEMEFLDQEFQAITRRVEELDDEKTKSQVTKSVSTKYRQDYNQSLLKYIDHILKSIDTLDAKNNVRMRFEELFPKSATIQKLVLNRDYTNLTLKSIKFLADLLTAFVPENGSLTPFSTNEASPAKMFRNNSAISVNTKGTNVDTTPISSALTQSPRYGQTPLSTKRNSGFQTPASAGKLQSRNSVAYSEKTKSSRTEKQSSTTGKKEQKSLYLPSRFSAATFGGSAKSPSTKSGVESPLDLQPIVETPSLSRRSAGTGSAKRSGVSPIDKFGSMLASKRETEQRNDTSVHSRNGYQDKNAAELELLQRDRDLAEKERELREKKRELMAKAQELEEKELAIREQKLQRENERKVSSESASGSASSQRSGLPPKTSPFEVDNRQRYREDEPESGKMSNSLKPILKSQHRDNTRDAVDGRNSDETLSHSSSTMKLRTAKEASEALREKSKHLAKVLTRVSSYDAESRPQHQHQPQHQRNERNDDGDISDPRDPSNIKRERTPVGSYKLDRDQAESFYLHSMKGSNKNLLADQYKDDDNNSAYSSEMSYNQSKSRGNPNNRSGARPPRTHSGYNSFHQTPDTTGRNDNSAARGDNPAKRVSFDANGAYDQDSVRQKYNPYGQVENRNHDDGDYEDEVDHEGEVGEEGEGEGDVSYTSPKMGDPYQNSPKGTHFSTFSVAFGRTESHQRSPSPPKRDVATILDVPKKGRVDHLVQSYDVVKGEETRTKALRDKGFIQYKVVPESVSGSGLKKTYSMESKRFTEGLSSKGSERDLAERDMTTPKKK